MAVIVIGLFRAGIILRYKGNPLVDFVVLPGDSENDGYFYHFCKNYSRVRNLKYHHFHPHLAKVAQLAGLAVTSVVLLGVRERAAPGERDRDPQTIYSQKDSIHFHFLSTKLFLKHQVRQQQRKKLFCNKHYTLYEGWDWPRVDSIRALG